MKMKGIRKLLATGHNLKKMNIVYYYTLHYLIHEKNPDTKYMTSQFSLNVIFKWRKHTIT